MTTWCGVKGNDMQAIITKYLGATNTKGARVRATWERFDGPVSVTVGYDHAFSQRDNHAYAAMELVRRHMDDGGKNWECGETPSGYVFVMSGEGYRRYFGVVR
jgi:hypothetical protein